MLFLFVIVAEWIVNEGKESSQTEKKMCSAFKSLFLPFRLTREYSTTLKSTFSKLHNQIVK